MTMKAIEYVGSFTELLEKSENEIPNQTKADVFQLPHTRELQERYVMTFAGPDAHLLAAKMTEILDALAGAAKQLRS